MEVKLRSCRSVIRIIRSYILNFILLSASQKREDGKRVQRFVISTKQMKGKTITRWGRRRWQIEGFFKTVKHGFSLHRFGQKTLLGVYRWLILSFVSYLLSYWRDLNKNQAQTNPKLAL